MIKVHIWYPINSLLDSPATVITREMAQALYPLPIPHYRPQAEFMRFGHAGIEFINVTSESGEPYEDGYRAFWPAPGADWTTPTTGQVLTSFDHDARGEGSQPTRTITINSGLNEALIYRYWYSLARQPLEYSFNGINCCSCVATSLQDGFPAGSSAPPYSPMSFAGGWFPWGHSNPYYLEDWVGEVNEWL